MISFYNRTMLQFIRKYVVPELKSQVEMKNYTSTENIISFPTQIGKMYQLIGDYLNTSSCGNTSELKNIIIFMICISEP